MNTQLQLFHGGTFQMGWGEPVRIADVDGELTVVSGRVWLTGTGDAQDHVLRARQRIAVAATDDVVVEPWDRGEAAIIGWQPATQAQDRRPATLARRAAAPLLRGVASAADSMALTLRAAELGFAALARTAASTASRAQGCISGGDSIASSGAVK